MKQYTWQVLLGTSLILASASLYIIQIVVFHDARSTFFYLLQDIAFIPIQVLLVTLILNQLLNMREKMAMLNKMNMVIGTFFSEAGTGLLKLFAGFDQNTDALRKDLLVTGQWSDRQFSEAAGIASIYDSEIDHAKTDLVALKSFLAAKRDFLLRLLENPNLLEHETFTELLWAVFHLTEELAARENLTELSPADGSHIAGDIKRAYVLLITEWLAYMKHLKSEYPYLFSLAVRMNPFDPHASVIVK
ncbi:MAG TPA: hypothetical protein VL122_12575 [Nitrospirota bacterium]|nr:hypothetical protein [Nitrospirota bacterium]